MEGFLSKGVLSEVVLSGGGFVRAPLSCHIKIDYTNCLQNDFPQCLISKLQRVQNAAARLVVRCHRWEYYYTSSHETALAPGKTMSAVLRPATGVSCTTSTGAPYITDQLEQRATRVLRSTTNNDFHVPPSRSRYGDRIFSPC